LLGKEKISLFVTVLVAIGTLVFALYYWLTELQVNWYALFICSIALHYLFKSLASHSVEGDTGEKEDLEKHVLKTSANVTYYVLIVLIFGLFFASVGFNRWIDFHNIPLLFALCAAIVVKPAVEFLIVRRYR
jgi:Ca2+/Na+ antiporter